MVLWRCRAGCRNNGRLGDMNCPPKPDTERRQAKAEESLAGVPKAVFDRRSACRPRGHHDPSTSDKLRQFNKRKRYNLLKGPYGQSNWLASDYPHSKPGDAVVNDLAMRTFLDLPCLEKLSQVGLSDWKTSSRADRALLQGGREMLLMQVGLLALKGRRVKGSPLSMSALFPKSPPMPIDHATRTLAGLERMYPGSSWDVVGSVENPDLPVCARYASLDAAWAALSPAGFKRSAIGVSMAHWGWPL